MTLSNDGRWPTFLISLPRRSLEVVHLVRHLHLRDLQPWSIWSCHKIPCRAGADMSKGESNKRGFSRSSQCSLTSSQEEKFNDYKEMILALKAQSNAFSSAGRSVGRKL